MLNLSVLQRLQTNRRLSLCEGIRTMSLMRSLRIAVCVRHDWCSATRSAHFCNKREHESCSQTVQRLLSAHDVWKGSTSSAQRGQGAHTHIHVVFLDWTHSPWHSEHTLHVPAAEPARLKVCTQDKLLHGVCSKSIPELCSEISMWQSVCFGYVYFRKFSKPFSCVEVGCVPFTRTASLQRSFQISLAVVWPPGWIMKWH